MLRALVKGKKRGSGLEGVTPHLGKFGGSEDLLTGSVFGRLMYFSDARLSEIFSILPGMSKAWPYEFGSLLSCEFWPRLYDLTGRIVEPDVLIDMANVVLLVEAKRYDDVQQQYIEQLERQRSAASVSDAFLGKPIIQVAVGGHSVGDATQAMIDRDCTELPLCRVKWRDLLASIARIDSPSREERHLIADIELAFELHGIGRKLVTFGSMVPTGIRAARLPFLAKKVSVARGRLRPLLPCQIICRNIERIRP